MQRVSIGFSWIDGQPRSGQSGRESYVISAANTLRLVITVGAVAVVIALSACGLETGPPDYSIHPVMGTNTRG